MQITVYYGQKSATTSTHQFDDASLKSAIEQAQELAKRRPDNPELMPLGEAAAGLSADRRRAAGGGRRSVRPSARALVKQSVDVCEKKGVLGAGYIPKLHWTDALANSEGLFALLPLRRGELHPHLPHAGRHRVRLGRARPA